MPKYAAIVTLGCRLNAADSALIAGRLASGGYTVVEADAPHLDLAVLNSCAVTAAAVRKSRNAARKLRKDHPDIKIVAAGCAIDLERERWRREKLGDVLLGNSQKRLWRDDVQEEFAPVFRENAGSVFPFRSRAFIKIQEGCDNFCSYCIVPHVRGREHSRCFEESVADCRSALAAGSAELVLTGVNTCAYNDSGRRLAELVSAVARLPGDFRIRLSSTEPHMNNRELLPVMAEPDNRVCRFLHLSLQHGSDRILNLMNRHYTRDEYASFVAEAIRMMPDIHIGTDFIVGFPGETEADFADALDFVRETAFANIHIFTYSRRAGTPAAEMPDQVPSAVAAARAGRLRAVAEASKAAFAARFIGRTLPVIFEERRNSGAVRGWSDNYIAVETTDAPLDRIVEVKITACRGGVLTGEVCT